MFGTADETRGQHSPIFTATSGKSDPMMVLAVMVILVIFIFVIFAIFAFKGERKDHGGLAEAATAAVVASAAGRANHYGGGADGGAYAYHMAHDNMRDSLREFGELKKEIAVSTGVLGREIDQAKFEAYKIAVEQAEKTRHEMAEIERARRSDELARERESNLYHRIVASLRPAGVHARAFVTDDVLGAGVGALG
jgi:hypothetical protein